MVESLRWLTHPQGRIILMVDSFRRSKARVVSRPCRAGLGLFVRLFAAVHESINKNTLNSLKVAKCAIGGPGGSR